MSRVAAGGGVCLCRADGGRPRGRRSASNPNKWIAWRDAEAETRFTSGDGVNKISAPAVDEGISS